MSFAPAIAALTRELALVEAQGAALRSAIAVLVECDEQDLPSEPDAGGCGSDHLPPALREAAQPAPPEGETLAADRIDGLVAGVQCAHSIARINDRAARAREEVEPEPESQPFTDFSDLPDELLDQLAEDMPGLSEERAARAEHAEPGPRTTGRTGQPLQRSAEAAGRKAEIVAAYLAGATAQAVADQFGLKVHAVYAMLKRADVPRRARGGDLGGRRKVVPVVASPPAPSPMPEPLSELAPEPVPAAAGDLRRALPPSGGLYPRHRAVEDQPVAARPESFGPGSFAPRGGEGLSFDDAQDQSEKDVLRQAQDDREEDEEEDLNAEFQARLQRIAANRTAAPKERPDYSRTALAFQRASTARAEAAGMAAQRTLAQPTTKTPTKPAEGREECRFCGIPGWKGCAHWLPFEGGPVVQFKAEDDPTAPELKPGGDGSKSRRGGIQAVRL